jgi:hypothetical protein
MWRASSVTDGIVLRWAEVGLVLGEGRGWREVIEVEG